MLASVRVGRSWAVKKFAYVGREGARGYSAPPEGTGEWWAADGELFRNEKLNLRRLLEPLPNQHLPNKKRVRDRHIRLLSTRLKLKPAGQELYWNAYMLRYQAMRDQWEKLYWDSMPEEKNVPTPIRGDGWKDIQGHDRKGPYNERFPGHRFDRNRSAGPSFVSWNNNKAPFKRGGMEQHPYGSSRDTTIFTRTGIEQHTYGSSRDSGSAYGSRRDTGMPAERVYRPYDRFSSGGWSPDK